MARLHGWFVKSLPQGGKETLLNFVAMFLNFVAISLPVYAMTCFKLSKDMCKRITSAMVEFWWSNEKGPEKYLGCPENPFAEKELGGLGFCDVGRFKQAFLGKQTWRICDQPSSLLLQILKHRDYKNQSFLSCEVESRPSYAWHNILFGHDLLKKGLIESIGNGQNTKLWYENWI